MIRLLITLVFTVSSHCVLAGDLSAGEVTKLISGNTVEAIQLDHGYKVTTYYSPDGTYRQLTINYRQQGKWHIDSQGYLCKALDGASTKCRTIVKEGNVWKLYKKPRNLMKMPIHKQTITKIVPGNPNNL